MSDWEYIEQLYNVWADDTTLNLQRFREQRAGKVADEILFLPRSRQTGTPTWPPQAINAS
jgi:hypothetical protein